MPKVSVLMPVYNEKEEYLRSAIESILEQTFTDFEFIIINDGSTNNAKDIILSYKDNRILYIENEQNIKLIKTLNKGISFANGEYIVRMDADDISVKNRLETLVEFMDKNQDIAAAGSHAISIPKPFLYKLAENDKVIKPFNRYIANCMMHPAMIIRASSLKENNLNYNEEYIHNEDYKLWIDLNEKEKLANIPKILLKHRLHENSVSVKYQELQQEITQRIILECLSKDFAQKNRQIQLLIQKTINKELLKAKECYRLEKFLTTVLKKLYKIFDPSIYPYIENTYKNLRKRIHNSTIPSIYLIFYIFISPLNRWIGIDNKERNNIIKSIFNKIIEEA